VSIDPDRVPTPDRKPERLATPQQPIIIRNIHSPDRILHHPCFRRSYRHRRKPMTERRRSRGADYKAAPWHQNKGVGLIHPDLATDHGAEELTSVTPQLWSLQESDSSSFVVNPVLSALCAGTGRCCSAGFGLRL